MLDKSINSMHNLPWYIMFEINSIEPSSGYSTPDPADWADTFPVFNGYPPLLGCASKDWSYALVRCKRWWTMAGIDQFFCSSLEVCSAWSVDWLVLSLSVWPFASDCEQFSLSDSSWTPLPESRVPRAVFMRTTDCSGLADTVWLSVAAVRNVRRSTLFSGHHLS